MDVEHRVPLTDPKVAKVCHTNVLWALLGKKSSDFLVDGSQKMATSVVLGCPQPICLSRDGLWTSVVTSSYLMFMLPFCHLELVSSDLKR